MSLSFFFTKSQRKYEQIRKIRLSYAFLYLYFSI